MKNSIKYLFGLLITPLLCLGVSFGLNIGGLNFNDGYVFYGSDDLVNYGNYFNTDFINGFGNVEYNSICFVVSGDTNGLGIVGNINFDFTRNPWASTSVTSQFVLSSYGMTCLPLYDYVLNSSYITNYERLSYTNLNANFFDINEMQGAKLGIYLFTNFVDSSDCSSIESELSSCSSNYNTLSGNYVTCQSDLASCTNSCDTLVSSCLDEKSSIQTSYSGCLESNSSLNQYNQSLSDQLNECLMTNGTGFDGSGNIVVYEYQLSRNDGLSDLYLPITNSIQLPYGYRGFLDNGVLAIKNLNSMESAYNIDDSEFNDMFRKCSNF